MPQSWVGKVGWCGGVGSSAIRQGGAWYSSFTLSFAVLTNRRMSWSRSSHEDETSRRAAGLLSLFRAPVVVDVASFLLSRPSTFLLLSGDVTGIRKCRVPRNFRQPLSFDSSAEFFPSIQARKTSFKARCRLPLQCQRHKFSQK